jgi:hypothetical protein
MFVGFENSSTGLNVAVADPDGEMVDAFSIDRREFERSSRTVLELLGAHVDVEAVRMASMCFAWGDDLAAITDIREVENRGNRGTPGFLPKSVDAEIYDQLRASEVPCVVVPGVNDELDCLHPYFRHHAQLTGPDKVVDARYARRYARSEGDEGETLIVANASSSSRAVVVSDGVLRGAFHWVGLVHGWPDGDVYDAVMAGEVDPTLVIQRSGFLYKPGKGFADWDAHEGRDGWTRQDTIREDLRAAATNEELLELVYWATLHDVHALVPFATHDGEHPLERIVVSGRLARVESPVDVRGRLQDALSAVAPTDVTAPYTTALGSALLAQDVHEGADEVLGIPVRYSG